MANFSTVDQGLRGGGRGGGISLELHDEFQPAQVKVRLRWGRLV